MMGNIYKGGLVPTTRWSRMQDKPKDGTRAADGLSFVCLLCGHALEDVDHPEQYGVCRFCREHYYPGRKPLYAKESEPEPSLQGLPAGRLSYLKQVPKEEVVSLEDTVPIRRGHKPTRLARINTPDLWIPMDGVFDFY